MKQLLFGIREQYSTQQIVVEIKGMLWLGPGEATVGSLGIAIPPQSLGTLTLSTGIAKSGRRPANDR
jgi:hypothetical protein